MNSRRLAVTVDQGTREKITDIDFSTDCQRMILAERGRVHNSLTFLYEFNGVQWNLLTDVSVGSVNNDFDRNRGLNSAGGVSFGADQKDGSCDTLIWSMGDCLNPSLVPNTNVNGADCNIYGPQGSFIPESSIGNLGGDLNSCNIFI